LPLRFLPRAITIIAITTITTRTPKTNPGSAIATLRDRDAFLFQSGTALWQESW